jgi:UDPglucose 6-dehydrogenase
VDAVNDRRRRRVVELAIEQLDGDVAGRRITVLGAAFKPNSDDVRDSPALHVARALSDLGAVVTVHDPVAIENARRAAPQLRYADSIEEAVFEADILIHLTEWVDYRNLDPMNLNGLVTSRVVIDGRNGLDSDVWNAAGWTVHALGRSTAPAWDISPQFESAASASEKEAVA